MKSPSVLVFAVLALAAVPHPAAAFENVNISWNGCTGPVDRAVLPGESVSLFASVLGHSEPHKAYLISIKVGTGTGYAADAWRFDAGGCQGTSRLTMDHLAPPEVAATCPSLQGTLPSFQLKDWAYDANYGISSYSIAVAYPNGGAGNQTQVNPAQRYFLARWKFDHSNSVLGAGIPGQTCGGVGQPVCLASISITDNAASWVDMSGQTRPWGFSNSFATANDHIGCPGLYPDPVLNSTWGAIKNQYR